MKLYIAEKPSLGRAIAEVLPKPHYKEDGCIRVGNGDYVSWCIGHLLEQAEPAAYNEAYAKWKMEHLPIVPKVWQMQAKPNTKKQLGVLRRLTEKADAIVHAGDPDREGQLLVDEVIDFLGVTGKKRASVKRCLISDLNPEAVTKALAKLRSNKEFVPLATSALARSRADWLYGINMTRAYTLAGRKVGYQGLLSVGRVQTPVLGIVVRRDLEIEDFVSKPFYEVLANIQAEGLTPDHFVAKWQPSESCEPYMDEEGRVISKKLAQNVVDRVADKVAIVTSTSKKNKSQAAPLPYNLSSLQIDAAKRFTMNAKQVLDVCQTLYERHKLLTYPRSDSRYLPKAHFKEGAEVLEAIGHNSRGLGIKAVADAVNGADSSLKSKAWNDDKVDAHHAIIPTKKKLSSKSLSAVEMQIYELVSRQYVAQFYPKHAFLEKQIGLEIEGGEFIAKSKETKDLGWKVLYPAAKKKKEDENEAEKEDKTEKQALPDLRKGKKLHCTSGELVEKNTQAPKPFNDASLLSAMTGIARFVQDAEIKKILKETDGLGTEATRAGILDLLFRREFLVRKGKQIHATETGRGLIKSLPNSASLPDMTAQWEATLNAMVERQVNYAGFMQPMEKRLYALISESHSVLPLALKGLSSDKPKFKKKSKAKK